jgi:hypothetical protein
MKEFIHLMTLVYSKALERFLELGYEIKVRNYTQHEVYKTFKMTVSQRDVFKSYCLSPDQAEGKTKEEIEASADAFIDRIEQAMNATHMVNAAVATLRERGDLEINDYRLDLIHESKSLEWKSKNKPAESILDMTQERAKQGLEALRQKFKETK